MDVVGEGVGRRVDDAHVADVQPHRLRGREVRQAFGKGGPVAHEGGDLDAERELVVGVEEGLEQPAADEPARAGEKDARVAEVGQHVPRVVDHMFEVGGGEPGAHLKMVGGISDCGVGPTVGATAEPRMCADPWGPGGRETRAFVRRKSDTDKATAHFRGLVSLASASRSILRAPQNCRCFIREVVA